MEDYDGFDPQRQRTAPSMRSPDLQIYITGPHPKAQVFKIPVGKDTLQSSIDISAQCEHGDSQDIVYNTVYGFAYDITAYYHMYNMENSQPIQTSIWAFSKLSLEYCNTVPNAI